MVLVDVSNVVQTMDVEKRVLYISYDGMTDPLGQAQVLPYIMGLRKKGYSFTLVSFEKAETYTKGKAVIEKIMAENDISWHPLNYTKTPPVLSTLKDLLTLKKKIKQLHKENPFDIIHCRSYIAAMAGLWMKKKFQTKFVFDMRGFWADERVDGGLWDIKNPVYTIIYNFFKKQEKQFLINADYTIALTENAKMEIASWDTDKKFAPIELIPCCVDLELFDPSKIGTMDVERLKASLNIQPGQPVITYIGSIGTWYMLNEMLDFFSVYLQENKDAILLFVTKENRDKIMESVLAKDIPPALVRITPSERKQMPLFIALSDFSIFFIKPAYSKKASSPTKQGEIMAMGIPVICNDHVGDTSLVVNKYDSGIVLNEFNHAGYQKAITEMSCKNFNQIKIREGANYFFSLSNGVDKYAAIYKKITS